MCQGPVGWKGASAKHVTKPRGVNTKHKCSGEHEAQADECTTDESAPHLVHYMLGRGVFFMAVEMLEGVIRSTALDQELSVDCNISITLLMVFSMDW